MLLQEVGMEESIPENQEETLVEGTLNTAEDD